MSNLLLPFFVAVDGDGLAMPGAKLEFYITGTSTPKNTYSDADLDISHVNANPVVADANGMFGPIYLTSGDYKVILTTSAGVPVATRDPVIGLGGGDALTTRGDLLTRDAIGYIRLPIGASGEILTSDGVDVSWRPPIIPRNSIQGLTYANNSSDPTNDIDIAVGGAMDSTNARMLTLASALTKRLDAVWAVGTNEGGLDTGSIGDTDYYIWLIYSSTADVTDVLFSASGTAPTMPTAPVVYNFKRLIGWFKRASTSVATTAASSAAGTATVTYTSTGVNFFPVGSSITVAGVTPTGFNETDTVTASSAGSVSYANSTAGPQTVAGTITGSSIIPFHAYETEGGGIDLTWDAPTLDIDLADTLTTTRRTDAVKVPLTFSTIAHLNVAMGDSSAAFIAWVYCPDQTDLAPSITAGPLGNIIETTTTVGPANQLFVRTSAAGLIAARASIATVDTYKVATMGFRWSRR